MTIKPFFSDEKKVERFKEILLSWLGTPYMHMVAVKGRGADCSLFIGQCLVEMGVFEKIEYEYYPRDWHIHTTREYVLEGIERNKKNLSKGLMFKEIPLNNELMFGDWIVFSISPKGVANHSAIYLGDGTFISAINKEGVCIKELNESWRKRLRYVFRLFEEVG